MSIRLNELEFVESNIGRLNCLIDLIPQELQFGFYECWKCEQKFHEDKVMEHEAECDGRDELGDCLDPVNCGMTVKDFECGDFEGFCENCREDLEYAVGAKMDEFYHGVLS